MCHHHHSPDSSTPTASDVNDADFREQAKKKLFSSRRPPPSTSPDSPTSTSDNSLPIRALPESTNRSRLMQTKLTSTTTNRWKELDKVLDSMLASNIKLYALKMEVLKAQKRLLEIEQLEKM
jgi:hypothetical protein